MRLAEVINRVDYIKNHVTNKNHRDELAFDLARELIGDLSSRYAGMDGDKLKAVNDLLNTL